MIINLWRNFLFIFLLIFIFEIIEWLITFYLFYVKFCSKIELMNFFNRIMSILFEKYNNINNVIKICFYFCFDNQVFNNLCHRIKFFLCLKQSMIMIFFNSWSIGLAKIVARHLKIPWSQNEAKLHTGRAERLYSFK